MLSVILERLDLTVTAAAEALLVTRVAPSNLLNAEADLSADMTLTIEKAFGVRMETLMRVQSSQRGQGGPPSRQAALRRDSLRT
jgi:addiction module HigA family antidote